MVHELLYNPTSRNSEVSYKPSTAFVHIVPFIRKNITRILLNDLKKQGLVKI
jgi:hypothetical protein